MLWLEDYDRVKNQGIQRAKLGRLLGSVSWGSIVGDMLRSKFLWAEKTIWELSLPAGVHKCGAQARAAALKLSPEGIVRGVCTSRALPGWDRPHLCLRSSRKLNPSVPQTFTGQTQSTGLPQLLPALQTVPAPSLQCIGETMDVLRHLRTGRSALPSASCPQHGDRGGKGLKRNVQQAGEKPGTWQRFRRCLQGGEHFPHSSSTISDLWVMSTPPPITCPDMGPTRHHCRTISWRGKFIRGQTPKCREERKIQNYCAGPERGVGQHQQDRDPGASAMVTNEHWYYQCTAGQRLFVNAGMTQPEPQQRLCSWYILCTADKSLENKSTDLTTKAEFNADSDCKSRKHPGEILSFDGCKKIIVQPFLNHIERDLKDLKEESR